MFHIASLHLIHVKVDKSFGQATRMGDLGLAMTMTSVFALFAFGSLDKPLVTQITFARFESLGKAMPDEMTHTPGRSGGPRNLQT